MRLTYRPLTHWPPTRKPTAVRNGALFKADWNQTLHDLEKELERIGGKDPVLEVDVSDREIRMDGNLHGLARPVSPRVVLHFTKKIGDREVPVTMPCDAFHNWRHNVRAIALGLEDLRRLDRYGITTSGEQYRGFTAIASSSTPALSTEQAADVLAKRSAHNIPQIMTDPAMARRAFQVARMKAHPDAGGNSGEFTLVTEAGRVLAAHHGVTSL